MEEKVDILLTTYNTKIEYLYRDASNYKKIKSRLPK